ncbi:MAG: hypothetical protein E7271_06175 [Lachnospiraceae bacterium]|jgi:hypothetical protein|nr:hypothetical protein [Lachnospiraceae bacterium]
MEREELQIQILKELISYSENLIPAVQNLITELREDVREDTGDYLNEVITGINWEIEVYNQCSDLISARSSYIDKKAMINAVKNLGESLSSGDYAMVAGCLEEDFIPFLNKLDLTAKMIVG